jgi:hypothetical protein
MSIDVKRKAIILKPDQSRVGNGIWMPQHIEVRAAPKIFFTKSLIIDKVLTYSSYRPAQTGIAASWRRPDGPGSTNVSGLSQIRSARRPTSFASGRVGVDIRLDNASVPRRLPGQWVSDPRFIADS